MTQKSSFYPLGGGLDIVTPAIVARPGTARAAANYEATFTGYRRISGYERFDGRPSPTDVFAASPDVVQGALDREAARLAIGAVPGSGPVRGIWYFRGDLYAWRNSADATKGVMHKATASGWQVVSDAFAPGGRYELVNYNFTGAVSGQKMYGVNGVGKGFQFDGTTVTFITTGMTVDTPIKISAHKHHLFFAFLGGSVQHSAVGDPLTWSPILGAGEIAVGDEVTSLQSAAPENLVITTRSSIFLLAGNDAGDWGLTALTNEAGALPYTTEKMGTVIYMDNRGVRSMATTSAFGNFSIGTLTQLVTPLFRRRLQNGSVPVATMRVRSRDTYRLIWPDGWGISIFMGKKQPEVMPIDLGIAVSCTCVAETTDTTERVWFGSDNGYVYEMDRGRSFDGSVVRYHLRLPFNHMGGPQVLKRWHKAVLEYDADGTTALGVSGEVDYADPNEPSLVEQSMAAYGGGGIWGSSNWDEFYWSAPIEGRAEVYIDAIGENLSLLMGSEQADEEPHVLQGLMLFFSVRGMLR